MDISQLQAAIEQILNLIQSQGPLAMQALVFLLTAIKAGATVVGSVANLLTQYPALSEVIDKLIVLIQSGAGIPEIAGGIAELASSLSISSEALLNLLYMLGGALALF